MSLSRTVQNNEADIARLAMIIEQAPIGSYIGAEGARVLASHSCIELILKQDEYLFREGETSASFFLIEEGRLARVRGGVKPSIIHTLERGDLVGELSFIDGTEHANSIMALSPATVLQFKKSDIEPLIESHPKVMFDFMRAVVKRVHHTTKEIGRQQMALSDYISTGGKGRF